MAVFTVGDATDNLTLGILDSDMNVVSIAKMATVCLLRNGFGLLATSHRLR
jgi:hypothetical protein